MDKRAGAGSLDLDFLMGTISAAMVKTILAPIDRYSMYQKDQGFKSIWRGHPAFLLKYCPKMGIYFALKDQFKRMLAVPNASSHGQKVSSNFAAGALAGLAGGTILYSQDYAYTMLMADKVQEKLGKGRQFNGQLDFYKKVLKSDGITGVFRGFSFFLVGNMVTRGLYFGLYDSLKPTFLPMEEERPSFGKSFLLAWGMIIKSLMDPKSVSSKDAFAAMVKITKEGGVRALYQGASFKLYHSFTGAGILACYDQLKFFFFGNDSG